MFYKCYEKLFNIEQSQKNMKFKEFSTYLEKLENQSKRLEKIEIISQILKKTNKNEHEAVLLLLEGRVYPQWSDKKLGIAEKIVQKTINTTYGTAIQLIEKDFSERGDLGLSAEKFCSRKTQHTLDSFGTTDDLELTEVFTILRKIAEISGTSSTDIKIQLIASLLSKANPIEAKYITRIVLGDLRIGISIATIRDGLIKGIFPTISIEEKENSLKINAIQEISTQKLTSFENIVCPTEELAKEIKKTIQKTIENVYDKYNELYKVALLAEEKTLEELNNIPLEVFTPLRVMLMQRVKTIQEATEKIPLPFQLEYKYDGFRCQIHKKGDKVMLFTRNIEEVTNQFPDIVAEAKKSIHAKEIILDGEILGIDKNTKKYLPFQSISQRIKRKHNIEKTIKELPVIYTAWDILYKDGETTLEHPLKKRRELLEQSITDSESFFFSNKKIITNIEEGEKFYEDSLSQGNEGVVVKDLDAIYQPGNRVGCWLKIKPIMDPLDLVITGAQWGEGKRAKWLTSFILSCKDEKGKLKTIGKVSSGLKEKEQEDGSTYEEMTENLKQLIDTKVPEKNKTISIIPKIIVSVAYEEIQKSPTYSSGFALRFPRILAIRNDLSFEDIDTTEKINSYHEEQKSI